jgi:methylmalonyl-CoA carboxyltransferase large subunit
MVEKKTKTAGRTKAAPKTRAVAASQADGVEATHASPLQAVLDRLDLLELRIQQLEAERDSRVGALVRAPEATAAPAPPMASDAAPKAAMEPMTEEIMTVIAAAVAAFLGERAHIRQVRLAGREAWAAQGRAAIMASHRWAVHRS